MRAPPKGSGTADEAYDVFLCHNSADKPVVCEIARWLRERGLEVWLDEWALRPGMQWRKELEQVIATVRSAVVCVGPSGVGPWADHEISALLDQAVRRGLQLVPVLLPSAGEQPELSLFLRAFMWVDFRQGITADGLSELFCGVAEAPRDPERPESDPQAPFSAAARLRRNGPEPSLPQGQVHGFAHAEELPVVVPQLQLNLQPAGLGHAYQPRRLGVPRSARDRTAEPQPDTSPVKDHDHWRESIRQEHVAYTEIAEGELLQGLVNAAARGLSRRFWILQGEPGSGKTTLLKRWTWLIAAGHGSEAQHGMLVPVRVCFRDLVPEVAFLSGTELAERLWSSARRESSSFPHLQSECRSARFVPLWLLDGWDEGSSDEFWTERFLERCFELPGLVVLTCRTAVLARDIGKVHIQRFGDSLPPFTVRDLDTTECERLLEQLLPEYPEGARRLAKQLGVHAQLRTLCGSPLLVSLLAESARNDLARATDPDLAASRSAFYARAIEHAWTEKLAGMGVLDEDTDRRDRVLEAIAARLGLGDRLRLSSEELTQLLERVGPLPDPASRDRFARLLVRAGILRALSGRQYEFVHLTFHEYYLARSWRRRELTEVLWAHWADARYQEALALLLSIQAESTGRGKVERALMALVAWGRDLYERRPRELLDLGRSPLSVALSLVHRAAIPAELVAELAKKLVAAVGRSVARRQATSRYRETPSWVLAALAKDEDDKVREAVARHPNTSEGTLLELAKDEVLAVRRNLIWNVNASPALLLQLAKDPGDDLRSWVASREDAPEAALLELASDPEGSVRLKVARNARATEGMLAGLAKNLDWVGRCAVASHEKTSPVTLADLAKDPDGMVRADVASNPHTKPSDLRELAKDTEERVREAVATNPSAPLDALLQLAKDAEDAVRCSVAYNPSLTAPVLLQLARGEGLGEHVAASPHTGPGVLVELAKDPREAVRSAVAAGSNTPAAVLLELANDPCEAVRFRVAARLDAPAAVLLELAKDPSELVRTAVASNPHAPRAALQDCWQDRALRLALADNPATPREILEKLARECMLEPAPDPACLDETGPVSVEPHENETTLFTWQLHRALLRPPESVSLQLAQNMGASESALHELAQHPDDRVRWFVAVNPNTPAAARLGLVKDRHPFVRKSLAHGPFTPDAVLVELAKDPDSIVRSFVVDHHNTPTAVILELASDPSRLVREQVAENPRSPEAALSLLAKDPEDGVRRKVANNRSTPVTALVALASDTDEWVRSAATHNDRMFLESL